MVKVTDKNRITGGILPDIIKAHLRGEDHPLSPLSKARAHLDKEVERGKNSPRIAGQKTGQHGGRVDGKK